MPLFSKQPSPGDNRIENAGRWPVRLTHFHLTDDYSFPATNYPEIFFVQQGGLLHETRNGKQTIREGFCILVHPGHQHAIVNPENVIISRLRYLPEWFTMEYSAIIAMPDVLTLFFDQSWLQFPRDDSLHVFNTRPETHSLIRSELDYLQTILKGGHHLEPLSRLSLLKIMAGVASDFQRFWRGAGGPELTPQVQFAFDLIERKVFAGDQFRDPALRTGGFDKLEVESAFRNYTGLSPQEYCERRRIFHAAYYLIATDDDPKQISRVTGFPDYTRFKLCFDETFEIAPEVYREKFRSLVGPDEST
ncbi:MAG: helix-turn-helix domain-containing protein [Verrucomicrobiales bacterium]|nr:helix-turn-helix domain-containing protein [Verrucomicrobiales bacterium]